jgi:hypothetical protein
MSQAKINDLKKEFTLVVIIKNDINDLFNILVMRIKKLKDIYDEIIKSNTSQFIFGLDSFKFQSKIMDLECEDLSRMYKMISNKMYCEYYKLYKMIVNYLDTTIKDTKLLYLTKVSEFPVYKDLEPFREYDFVIIQNIHETILTILLGINDLVLNNKEELKLLKNKKEVGFNIDNFINSFQYNIDTIVQQIKLYSDYVSFFHKTHLKYLRRTHAKLRLFLDQINTDIRFDDTEKCDYKYDMDKSTVESVKSMIYDEDFEIDNFLNIVSEVDSVSNDGIIYENIYVEKNEITEDRLENINNVEVIQDQTELVSEIEQNTIPENEVLVSEKEVESDCNSSVTDISVPGITETKKKRGRPRKSL